MNKRFHWAFEDFTVELKIIFNYFCQCLCVFCELGGSNDSVSENRVVGSYQRVKLAKLLPLRRME